MRTFLRQFMHAPSGCKVWWSAVFSSSNEVGGEFLLVHLARVVVLIQQTSQLGSFGKFCQHIVISVWLVREKAFVLKVLDLVFVHRV